MLRVAERMVRPVDRAPARAGLTARESQRKNLLGVTPSVRWNMAMKALGLV